MIDGPNPSWRVARASVDADAAVKSVKEIAAAGVDGIKLYAGIPPDWLSAIMKARETANLYTAGFADELWTKEILRNRN